MNRKRDRSVTAFISTDKTRSRSALLCYSRWSRGSTSWNLVVMLFLLHLRGQGRSRLLGANNAAKAAPRLSPTMEFIHSLALCCMLHLSAGTGAQCMPRFRRHAMAIRSRLIKVLPMPLNKNSRKAIFRHSNVGIGISAVSITRASKPSLIEWVMVPRVLWKGIQG